MHHHEQAGTQCAPACYLFYVIPILDLIIGIDDYPIMQFQIAEYLRAVIP